MTKTEHDLEWGRLVAAVVGRCVGPAAKRGSLPVAATFAGTRIALAETAEAWSLVSEGEPLPLDGIRDLSQHLLRLDRQGALDGPALRDVRSTVAAARSLRRFLSKRRERCPRLWEACATDPTLDALGEEIDGAVEQDGTLRDNASPELKRLRTETANLRARLVGRLEELIHKHADLLSDRFFTIREGRYVLPVRTDAHERVPGLVHATSASGATVFVEPRSLIAQGNRLKMAQGEMEREEARILAILSDLVRERLPALEAASAALDHADLRNAAAKLGRDLDATIPELVDAPRVSLSNARHPLLLLDGAQVVPNDLELEAGHGLVLSGPNAGGKTVALKMLGLAAMMVRAGLPVPADEGSVCGFFAPILTDVGDEQSLEKNLSTFSAHITNLVRILEDTQPGSLVLLDEVATGTDPQEGAALACAIVDVLCRRGAAVAVTTHYEPLKALALRDERLRNASVGFDVERLEPTFHVVLDVPGASSALAVAQRFGIPTEVIETARRVLPEQSRTFDELVRKLDDQRQALEIERAGLADERRALERRREEVERKREALLSREREQLSKEGERLLAQVRRARSDVREVRKRLRQERLEAQELQALERRMEEAARAAREAAGAGEPKGEEEPARGPVATAESLEIGTRVWVPRLRAEADVVEAPSRGKVRVAAGPMKLSVAIEEVHLLRPDGESAPVRQASKQVLRTEEETPRARPQSSDNTLDVRGLRVDEALGMLESFVDRLYGASEPVAYIVHGVGTGALRDAIRDRLREDDTYVDRARPGHPDEGGDRLTVVYLR